jgi:cell division protein FtsQ
VSAQPRAAARPVAAPVPAAAPPGRGRSRRLLLAAVAVGLVLAAATWVVGFTGVLGVRSVTVTGLRALPAGTVLAAAAVERGQPLARVDTDAVADRVRAVPGVDRVAVTRAWPATLRITVTERQAVAVAVVTGVRWLVDRTGVRFQRVDRVPAGLPRLAVRDPRAGDPATAAGLSALTALGPPVRGQLLVVAANTPDSVTLTLRGGRTVIWGGAADPAAKAQVLAALLTRPGTVYDVSTPSVVTVR